MQNKKSIGPADFIRKIKIEAPFNENNLAQYFIDIIFSMHDGLNLNR